MTSISLTSALDANGHAKSLYKLIALCYGVFIAGCVYYLFHQDTLYLEIAMAPGFVLCWTLISLEIGRNLSVLYDLYRAALYRGDGS